MRVVTAAAPAPEAACTLSDNRAVVSSDPFVCGKHVLTCTQVHGLDEADQRLLGPVLRSPVLRQLLTSMTAAEGSTANGSKPSNGSAAQAWLTNPRVLQLLREAARALKKGRISEQQLLELLKVCRPCQCEPYHLTERAPLGCPAGSAHAGPAGRRRPPALRHAISGPAPGAAAQPPAGRGAE